MAKTKTNVANGSKIAAERGGPRNCMQSSIWDNGDYYNIQLQKGWIPKSERDKPRDQQKFSNIHLSLSVEEARFAVATLQRALGHIDTLEPKNGSRTSTDVPAYNQ